MEEWHEGHVKNVLLNVIKNGKKKNVDKVISYRRKRVTKKKLYDANYCKQNRKKHIKRGREYYKIHKEEFYLRSKQYNQKNKKIVAERKKEYSRKHPEVGRMAKLKNKLSRKLRIPNFGHEGVIDFIKKCPKFMQIDHIIPLHGKLVSGLHVIWNLQYLTKYQNRKKYNQFDGTVENNNWRVS